MKTRYIVKNTDITVQRLQLEQGEYILINPGQSIITTCPPQPSYIFEVTPISDEVEQMMKMTKSGLLNIIEPFVINKKVMTNKEWKSLDSGNLDNEAKALYNLLESYVIGRKVLSKSEFEQLKSGTDKTIQGGKK